MRYYLIAGEASGDLHAANLMRALSAKDKKAEFRYFGGEKMQAVGGELVLHYREMAFMGFIAVLLNLKKVFANLALCKKDIIAYSPDVVILVDYPGFNLKIAKWLKTHTTIPVHYYISPKIWAWKEYRIKAIKRDIDLMLSILPFEVAFYKKHHYPITYVGNPTVDELAVRPYKEESRDAFLSRNNLSDRPIIAVLAGSRVQEIHETLPKMIEAASSFTTHQSVVAGAPSIPLSLYQEILGDKFQTVTILFDQTYPLLQQADAALVTSGTATLETAIIGTPQVVCYEMKGGRLVFELFMKILHVKYVSLVNLIADRAVVEELLAYRFTCVEMRRALAPLLKPTPQRVAVIEGYKEVSDRLGEVGAPIKAADTIIAALQKNKG